MRSKLIKVAAVCIATLGMTLAPADFSWSEGVTLNACQAPSCKPHAAWVCWHIGMPEPMPDYCDPNDAGC